MDQRFSLKHRYYAIVCLSALAWLMPTASAVSAVPADRLQALISDTAAQVQLAYRQHPVEREHRREQVAAVVAAWRTASRSELNNERLATWLHAAILSSMPGSREPLPPAPNFAAKINSDPAGSSVVKKAATISERKPDADPFRDDPVGE